MNQDKITILVVDDSEIIRYSLEKFFTGNNIEVITCNDGLQGIQKASKVTPSLIFLDLQMPNCDGIQMLRLLKGKDDLKNVPVIIISANTSRENILAVLKAGANGIIKKPLRKDVIIKNVKDILGENFLKAKNEDKTPDQEEKEFLNELCQMFLEQFPSKKQKMLEALETNDVTSLSAIAHEMKGAGGSIGYTNIMEICGDIESSLKLPEIPWDKIKIKCEEFFSIAKEMEKSIANKISN